MARTQEYTLTGIFHPNPKLRPPAPAIGVLSILYVVGVIGILLPIHPDFILLTPVNLLLSTVLMLWYHMPGWDSRTWIFLILTYLTGFIAELVGVQTGWIFGNYTYGQVLGPKILGTPLIIGVNWVLLTYAAGVTVKTLFPALPPAAKAFLSAAAMVGLDLLIEPMAVKYGMWSWQGGTIPLKNYIGWMAVAFPLQYLFARWQGSTLNKVAMPLFTLQILFFFALHLGEIFF